MLIFSKLDYEGNLTLDVYSHNRDEFGRLKNVIFSVGAEGVTSRSIDNYLDRRKGVRFSILAIYVSRFEKFLGVSFISRGKDTKVRFDSISDGNNFSCRRIDTPPNGCQTIVAKSEDEAMIKCAMIAGEQNWLGAVPRSGRCR